MASTSLSIMRPLASPGLQISPPQPPRPNGLRVRCFSRGVSTEKTLTQIESSGVIACLRANSLATLETQQPPFSYCDIPSSSKSNPPYSGLNSNPGGNQGQSIAVQSRDQSQAREQHSLPGVPNTIASGGFSSNLASERSTVCVSVQVPLPNSATENANSQKSVGNLSGHGAPINVSANNVRQEQGRQHSPHIGTQQNRDEQLNPHLGIQVKQENISPSCIAQQKQLQQYQQQQQKLLKPAQKQTSQQSVVQTPAIWTSETHVTPLSDLQQDQMSSFEQTTRSVIKNHPHTAFRQIHRSQETPDIHQNVSSRPDNLVMQSQKQPHMIGTPGLQQQQTRLPGQPNNVQQWFQVQIMNLSSAPHEQLTERNNISVLQQSLQLLGTQCASSGMCQCNFKMQEETQHTASALPPNQGQRSQPQSLEWQLKSQSWPDKMRQLPNPTEQDQQQTYLTSGTVTSTSEKRISFVGNWQVDTYRKFKKQVFDMLQKVTYTIQQFNSVSQQTEIVSIEIYKALKIRLREIILHLNVPKRKITPSYKENLGSMERQILLILRTYGRAKPVPSLQHGQLSSDVHSTRQMVQLRSQTPQVHTHQDERKLPLQSVNLQCSATTHWSNATNLVNSSSSPAEHPTLKHDMVHLRKNLTEQYSGQANSLTTVQQVNQTRLEEITVINHQLIDTVLDISNEDTPLTVASAPIKVGEGTIIRCSFIAVAISPSLKSQQVSAQMPLRLVVPANYPLCAPIFIDKLRVDISDELEDLSAKVKSKLNISLRSLTEPLSLGEIARTWDVCARAAISEYLQQLGGGSFSSKYGMRDDCLSAA